jgi:DNA (cytosine-5)-methyltransferase 1
MSALTVGSLFSGIGGLDLGLERAGMRVIWQSEIDPFASDVLAKHWPDVPNLGDVREIEWSEVERPDVICGGYPCQPFSLAGVRRGEADPRHLWPFMFDAVRALRPRFVLGENVGGHLSLGFDRVLCDLAAIGFDAEWSVVSACSVGAPHTRPRLFWLAHPASPDAQGEVPLPGQAQRWPEPGGSGGVEGGPVGWLPEPDVDRMADGIPRRVVRHPLHALGNAVVPPVAEFVGRRIIALDAALEVSR